jgi:recombination protein RecT
VSQDAAQQYRTRVERYAKKYIEELFGSKAGQEAAGRMSMAFRLAAQKDERLYTVPPEDVAQCIALSAMTNLMPGGPFPEVYINFRHQKNPQTGRWDLPGVQWTISYRGMMTLVGRAGYDIEPYTVHDCDDFGYSLGMNPDLQHVPGDGEHTWDTLTHAYVVVWPKGGGRTKFRVIDKAAIEERRARSDSYRRFKRDGTKCPWSDWPVEQAMKTAIRYAVQRGIVQLDRVGQVAMDQDGQRDVIDAEPASSLTATTTNPTDEPKAIGMDELKGWAERVNPEPEKVPAEDPTGFREAAAQAAAEAQARKEERLRKSRQAQQDVLAKVKAAEERLIGELRRCGMETTGVANVLRKECNFQRLRDDTPKPKLDAYLERLDKRIAELEERSPLLQPKAADDDSIREPGEEG